MFIELGRSFIPIESLREDAPSVKRLVPNLIACKIDFMVVLFNVFVAAKGTIIISNSESFIVEIFFTEILVTLIPDTLRTVFSDSKSFFSLIVSEIVSDGIIKTTFEI